MVEPRRAARPDVRPQLLRIVDAFSGAPRSGAALGGDGLPDGDRVCSYPFNRPGRDERFTSMHSSRCGTERRTDLLPTTTRRPTNRSTTAPAPAVTLDRNHACPPGVGPGAVSGSIPFSGYVKDIHLDGRSWLGPPWGLREPIITVGRRHHGG